MQTKTGEQDRSYPLIQTKLFIPPLRPELVQRTHLIEKLNRAADRKLTLISAPAGFGKTTLLGEWISDREIPVAWISLDKGDDDPDHFMQYLVAALQKFDKNIGKTTLGMLESPQPTPIKSIMTSLIKDISDLPNHSVLVLDDYHCVTAKPIHGIVQSLLDYMPAQLCLVIATRVDPPLPLARMRARNQLNELRTADLCFTYNETEKFLKEVMRLGISGRDISILSSQTEGWIAGLQLAALSMQDRKNLPNFIRTFSGDDRHVIDYFAEEVLNQQSEQVQNFLLETSILNRLSGSLCDFVTGQEDGQERLVALERANLFIIPLDNRRCWYRYHHLFADLLHARLRQSKRKKEAELHMRAAEWFARNKLVAEAVEHTISAGNYEQAARLVEQNTFGLLSQGKLNTLLKWIRTLPKEVARRRPWLCIYQAWALCFAGQFNDVAPLLKDAERCMHLSASKQDSNLGDIVQQEMMGNIAAIQAHISVLIGDFHQAIEYANLAIETLPKSSLFPCSVAHWALGIGNYLNGDIEIARHSCAEVVKLGRAMDNVWTTVTGLTDLASVHQIQGQLSQTATLCREALQLATECGAQSLGYMGRVEAKLADVLYEQNELVAAKNYLTDSIEKAHRWKNPNHFVYSYCLLALVLRAQGNLKGSFDVLMEADHIRGKFPILPVLESMLEKCNVRLWLSQKNMKPIEHWAEENDIKDAKRNDASFKIPKDKKQMLITLARVFIAMDNADKALNILKHLGGDAESEKRIGVLIEILILQVLALQALNKKTSALKVLERALALAEPGGYVRVFVDEGPSIAILLEKLLNDKAGVSRAYVNKLLSAFQVDKLIQTQDGLVEQLSERELEVLRLIAAGLSNRRISEELYISLSTAKTHLRNIYGKLNVHSRTKAIVKAKELALL